MKKCKVIVFAVSLFLLIGIIMIVVICNLDNNSKSDLIDDFYGTLTLDNYSISIDIPNEIERTSVQRYETSTKTAFIKRNPDLYFSDLRVSVSIEKTENSINAKKFLENEMYSNDAFPDDLEIKTTILNQKEIYYLDFEYEQYFTPYSSNKSKFHYICITQDIADGYIYKIFTQVKDPNPKQEISINSVKEFLNFNVET